MRRIALLALVGALMLAMVAGTAAAKHKGSDDRDRGKGTKKEKTVTYELRGTVTAVSADSVTIKVEKGNKAARVKFPAGSERTFAVDSATRIERNDEDAALSDVQVGDEVKVQSKAPASATTFTARKLHAEGPEVVTTPPPSDGDTTTPPSDGATTPV